MNLNINFKQLGAEFVIVVIGVAVALAADGWREDLQLIEEESLYLNRLSEDLNATLNMFQFVQARLDTMRDATLTLIEVHDAGESSSSMNPNSLAALYIEATNIDFTSSMLERGATYRELATSGRLQLIRDSNLRSRLVFFYLALDDLGPRMENMFDAGLRDRISGITGYRPYRLTSQTLLSIPGIELSDENQDRLLDAMRDSPPSVVDLRRMHAAMDNEGVVVAGLIIQLQSLLEAHEQSLDSL